MVFRVLHHNQCFDGACSAAVFSKFHCDVIGTATAYEYHGLAHTSAGPIPDSVFGPYENSVVDFKYSPSPRLTWWFDHHQSAFLTPQDRAHFEATQRTEHPSRHFFDPDFISCTSFIAQTAARAYDFDLSGLDDLLYWADIIDGARFASARMAVEMHEPALQLALVIENADTPDLIPRIIPHLTVFPFADIVALPFIQQRIHPLLETHRASIDLIRQRATLQDEVIFFDLLDRETEALSKFIPYFLYPEATYTIAVTRSRARTKISVGTNPWTPIPASQLVNLAETCERFGGGGHARVGAISFGPDQADLARTSAQGIAADLRASVKQREAIPYHSE